MRADAETHLPSVAATRLAAVSAMRQKVGEGAVHLVLDEHHVSPGRPVATSGPFAGLASPASQPPHRPVADGAPAALALLRIEEVLRRSAGTRPRGEGDEPGR